MLYDDNLKQAVLDVLEHRVSGIADCIQALFQEGYIPNKNKDIILKWGSILIDAYENIDLFSKEQQDKIDIIYNKIIKL